MLSPFWCENQPCLGVCVLGLKFCRCLSPFVLLLIFHLASAPYREDSLFSEQHLPRPARGTAAFAVSQPTDSIGIFIRLERAFCHKLVQTFL